MIINDLVSILKQTEYPIFYSHFTVTDNNPAPDPPFLTYIVSYSSNM